VHRRTIEPARHRDRRTGQRRREPRHLALETIFLFGNHATHIDSNRRRVGHHVVGGAGFRDGRSHGGAELRLGEGGDARHLVREFDERVDALLGLEPRVRRTTRDAHDERARAFACDLERTTVGARLEHQHGSGSLGALFEQCARRVRSDFFVGGDQDFGVPPLLHRSHAVDRLHDASFHVEDSGAAADVSLARERAARHGAARKHGVVVPNDEHLGVVTALPVHVRAAVGCDDRRRLAEHARHEVGKKVRAAIETIELERG